MWAHWKYLLSQRKWQFALLLFFAAAAALVHEHIPFLKRAATAVMSNTSLAGSKSTEPAPGSQVVEWADAIIYVPSTLKPAQKLPLVVSFSPTADAAFMVKFWSGLAERHGLIVYASKLYKNHTPMNYAHMRAYIDRALAELPVERSKIIFTGISGGGSFSHSMNAVYPGLARGLIINTGQFWEEGEDGHALARKNLARLGRTPLRAAFLASPTDFRYREMQRDQKLLKELGSSTLWIEFAGGHVYAPEAVYDEAVKWVLSDAP